MVRPVSLLAWLTQTVASQHFKLIHNEQGS